MDILKTTLLALGLLLAAPAEAVSIGRWSSEIEEASTRFKVPETWIRRVMEAESGGRTRLAGKPIVSRAGAMGLMQLMPGTWADMRKVLALGSDPHDPRDNILAGTLYLRLLFDRFGYPGLFAAYNAGPQRFADALSGRWRLPAETRAYAPFARAMPGPGTRRQRPHANLPPISRTPSGTTLAPPPPDGLFVPLAGPGTATSQRGE